MLAKQYKAAGGGDNFIIKILGIDNLEYKIRLLEKKNYWRDKYNGSYPLKQVSFRAVNKGLLPSKMKKKW